MLLSFIFFRTFISLFLHYLYTFELYGLFHLSILPAPFSSSSSSGYSVFIQCFPFSRDGRIYPIPSAISRTPSPLVSSQSILLLQTNLLCLLFHLLLPGLLRSSSLSLASHFKIQSNPQNTIVIPPQYMSIPSSSICCC